MGKLISIKINNTIKPLYDIEIQDNHNFVANNILVKNSEQYLSRDSLCVLSSINAERFSNNPDAYEQELSIIGESILRFLDNVNECELKYNTYATPFQKLSIEKLRRCGAGITSIAGWLFKGGYEYGSENGNTAIEKFQERYNFHLYKTSINLGQEKGNFGLFNKEKYEQSPFIQNMMKLGLEFTHMRTCNCSSIAPCGSLSLMFQDLLLSSGVESAYYGLYYWKRTRMSGKYEYYFCVPTVVKKLFREKGYQICWGGDFYKGEIPDTIKDTWDGKIGLPIAQLIDKMARELGISIKKSTEISPFDKLNLLSSLMKSVDSSISTTFILPEDYKKEDVSKFIIEAWQKEIKSLSVFPDKKMYGIISDVPFKKLAQTLLKQNVNIHKNNFSEEELKELDLDRPLNKRPKELPCEIFHVSVKHEPYTIIVGLLNGKPYELFSISNNGLNIGDAKEGRIVRKKKNFYQLVIDAETSISPITALCNEKELIISRLLSLSLRSGIELSEVVCQIEKAGEFSPMMGSLAKAISKVLKKYIPENTTLGDCPSCKTGKLIKKDGCQECICGYSVC